MAPSISCSSIQPSKDRVISGVGPAGYFVISIQAGEWIACLPHQVLIRVTGAPRADGSSPDAVAS